MFKTPRFFLFLIVILTALAVFIDIPNIPIKFSLGGLKVDRVLTTPQIDLDAFGYNFQRDLNVRLGLDLKGGTSLILRAEMKGISPNERDKALEAVKEVISRRIDSFGVSEPTIQTSKVGDDYRIIVDLPGLTNVEEAKALIGQTAKLEFREFINQDLPPGTIPSLENTKSSGVTGKDLKSASVDIQQAQTADQTNTPVVRFELTDQGSKKFKDLTTRLIGKPLVVFLDDFPVSAPVVQSAIEKEGVITGVTSDEAKRLAIQLSAGALPVEKIDVISQRTIGPTLGETSVNRSILAGIIGFIILSIYMILYYKFPGVLAVLALILYVTFVLAIFKLIPITLTLAGIVAFILSIGMAVDANILIFERMKEELRGGRSKKEAIEIGFIRAWSSIRDSNVSSLITASILFWFGSGSIKGFAVALSIGILISMFTAITVTRNLLRVAYR